MRTALLNKSRIEARSIDYDSNIYIESEDAIEIIFAQQFSDVGGNFIFCEHAEDFITNIAALIEDESFGKIWCAEPAIQELLKQSNTSYLSSIEELEQAGTSVTSCEFLIARTGSILISSKQIISRKATVSHNNIL